MHKHNERGGRIIITIEILGTGKDRLDRDCPRSCHTTKRNIEAVEANGTTASILVPKVGYD